MIKKVFLLSMASVLVSLSAVCYAADRITLPNSTISLESPSGFTKLSDAEMAKKFKGANAPKFATGNASRGTTIAYELKPVPVKDSELDKGLIALAGAVDKQIPGVSWVKKEIIELAGKRWIYLEMKSAASNANIHNIMLVTPFENQMLVLNFNSTTDEFPKNEKALRASLS